MAKKKKKKKLKWVRTLIAIVLVAAVVLVFAPRMIHRCDSCGKVFFGTGYRPIIVMELFHTEQKVVCRDCAVLQHAAAKIIDRDVDSFKLPLF